MKKIFKKNQIIITSLALLMAIAGYINYSKTVKDMSKETSTRIEQEDIIEPGDAILTNTLAVSNKLTKLKLTREQKRDENMASLNDIINNSTLDNQTKQAAIESVTDLVKKTEMEMELETTIEAKGYDGVYVSLSDKSVDVCINTLTVDDVTRAQIEDIVTRKTGFPIENVVITPLASEIAD